MSLFDTTPFHQDNGDSSRCRKQSPRDSISSISTAEFTLLGSERSSGGAKVEALFKEARGSGSTGPAVLARSSLALRSATLERISAICSGSREAKASLRARLFAATQDKTATVRFLSNKEIFRPQGYLKKQEQLAEPRDSGACLPGALPRCPE